MNLIETKGDILSKAGNSITRGNIEASIANSKYEITGQMVVTEYGGNSKSRKYCRKLDLLEPEELSKENEESKWVLLKA